jgi:restriction system protein
MRPSLVAVDGGDPKSHAQIRDSVAAVPGVTDEERKLLIRSGKQ